MEYEIINFSEILNIPGVWVELYFDNEWFNNIYEEE